MLNIASPNEKNIMEKLYNLLLDLDSDEGIRIENSKGEEKIYINRNILGVYNILIRTKKKPSNKGKEKSYNSTISAECYLEEIISYDNALLVVEFLKHNMDKPTIWLY